MYATPQPFSRLTAKLLAASFLSAALFMASTPAEAFGGGPPAPASSASCSAKKTKNSCQSVSKCWWSTSSKSCKKSKNQSGLNANDKLYAEGRLLAKSGEFAKAIAVLKTANLKDPQVLNYLGYSHRKSGDLKTAIGYYKAALAIDPNFVLARGYLGEGYVKAGRLDLAKLELDQIGKRCGKNCKEYIELAMVIDKGVDSNW